MDSQECKNIKRQPSAGKVCEVQVFDTWVDFTRVIGTGEWGKANQTVDVTETKNYRGITEASFNRLMAVLVDWHKRDWCELTIWQYHNNLCIEALI